MQLKNLVNAKDCAGAQAELDRELAATLRAQNDPFEPPDVLRARFGYRVNEGGEIPYTW